MKSKGQDPENRQLPRRQAQRSLSPACDRPSHAPFYGTSAALLPGFRQGKGMIGPEAGRPCLHRFTTDEQSGISLGQCPACRFVLFRFPVVVRIVCFHGRVFSRLDTQVSLSNPFHVTVDGSVTPTVSIAPHGIITLGHNALRAVMFPVFFTCFSSVPALHHVFFP